MRIIDKTPLVEKDGTISTISRIKGTLQYGFSWYPDLQAQQKAIAKLEKKLSKKFTLLRNVTLGKSKITVPLILIGPPGVQVIFVTHLEGTYRAKNDTWGTYTSGNFKETSINLLKRTAQLGKAVQVYLERSNFQLPDGVEPILLSTSPALHISSVRPMIRIIMSDAINHFVASLAQEPPIMSVEIVHEMADSLVNPRPPKPPAQAKKEAPAQHSSPSGSTDIEEIDFALEESAPTQKPRKVVRRKPVKKAPQTYMGMTSKQLTIVGVMGLVLVFLLVIFILGVVLFI